MIDYVLDHTGFEKLHYIGHSQGTTSFFVMASERPAYNDKILSMQALAPVAFMSNLRSPFVRAASYFLNTLDVRHVQLASLADLIHFCFIIRLLPAYSASTNSYHRAIY